MKTITSLILLLVMAFVSNAQAPITANIYGANYVSPGQTVTYTSDIPPGYYIVWSVSYGTIIGSSYSYIVNNSNTVTIQWNTPNCGANLVGNVYVNKFPTWVPSGPPSYSGGKSVTIQAAACPPPPPPNYPCSAVSASIESVWNNPSIPQSAKCGILTSIVSSYTSGGYTDFSCIDWHGCPH